MLGHQTSDVEHLSPASLAFAAMIAGLSLISAVLIAAGPADAREAAGVFPPWWAAGDVTDAAAQAGAVVAVGALPFVVIVRTDRGDAAHRLRDVGALFSIDPGAARSCGAVGA